MSRVTVVGGGICGLLTALLLGEDGHEVTVLERDAESVPSSADDAWQSWERRGVRQFRIGHLFLSRFRDELERELPGVVEAMADAGALRFNILDGVPDQISGGWRPGDDRFEILTGRRPVIEAAVGACADSHSRVDVRRGTAVEALVVESRDHGRHVVGVRTEAGDTIDSDLLVDAAGKLSPFPRLLTDTGCEPPEVESEDSGFAYYGRTFRSEDGSIPVFIGPLLGHYDSISILTLPADNGTWFVAVVAAGGDAALRALNDNETWTRFVRAYPLVAHWVAAEAITDVVMMAKIEDRIRHYSLGGSPVVTGFASVGDSWACTNPSLGRGATIGLLNGIVLRDQLREDPLKDPAEWTSSWLERVRRDVEPWYRDTLVHDRHRLADVEADIEGRPRPAVEPQHRARFAIDSAATKDPDVLRAYMDHVLMFRTAEEISSDTNLVDRALALANDSLELPPGPGRAELLALLRSRPG